jgi:exonuclease SbcC
MIVLDEIFGSQDTNRKRQVLVTLNSLSNRFKQIFLITHVEDVKELMGNVIKVTEAQDGTSIAEVMQ